MSTDVPGQPKPRWLLVALGILVVFGLVAYSSFRLTMGVNDPKVYANDS